MIPVVGKIQVKIIFLLSLPRSGSTLLQRILMGSPQIHTTGEPWLALPLVGMTKDAWSFSIYGHSSLRRSVDSFCEQLASGRTEFLQAFAPSLHELYRRVSTPGTKYFLDKTPRYYRIIPELIEMFPQARFLVLTRSPVAVFASILSFIQGDIRQIATWRQDIVQGYQNLSTGIELLGERAHVVSYEGLVNDTVAAVEEICDWLQIEKTSDMIDSIHARDPGRGDPTGTKTYGKVSNQSIEAWRERISSHTLRRIAHAWIDEVPEYAFEVQGHRKAEELGKLDLLPTHFSLKHEMQALLSRIYFNYRLNLNRAKGADVDQPTIYY